MNTERIKEIQEETAYPESVSVQQALLKVWNETEQEQLRIAAVISRLKTDLDKWIDGSEKASGNLRDIGHDKEAQNFDGQATAYWVVKNYLEVNGL